MTIGKVLLLLVVFFLSIMASGGEPVGQVFTEPMTGRPIDITNSNDAMFDNARQWLEGQLNESQNDSETHKYTFVKVTQQLVAGLKYSCEIKDEAMDSGKCVMRDVTMWYKAWEKETPYKIMASEERAC